MIKDFDQKQLKGNIPELRTGYTVRIQQKIREGDKERLQAFEGLIIKINNGTGPNRTITVRKVVDGVGVEKILPIHSPNIAKIEVTRKSKVRRAKLYYVRDTSRKIKLYQQDEKEGTLDTKATAKVKKASAEAKAE